MMIHGGFARKIPNKATRFLGDLDEAFEERMISMPTMLNFVVIRGWLAAAVANALAIGYGYLYFRLL